MNWRPVVGYEGFYEISDTGRLRSVSRMIFTSYKNRRMSGKNIKTFVSNTGYFRTLIYRDGGKQNVSLHRLVAEAFIPNPKKLPQVNHINANRHDNRVENLEWVSSLENWEHANRMGRVSNRGEGAHLAKLNEFQVREIRERCSRGERPYTIAREYDISGPVAYSVAKRITWRHVP